MAASRPAGSPFLRAVVSQDLPDDFLDRIADGGGQHVAFTLPDGRAAAGDVELKKRDGAGWLYMQGTLSRPEAGTFYFQRQTAPGVAGRLAGYARFTGSGVAFSLQPKGTEGAPVFVQTTADAVVCAGGPQIQASLQTHPTNIPAPSYQAVTPFQSLPGATAVLYLDFDGESGPFPGWGSFDAAASGASNAQVFDTWRVVSEDFLPFNINVTTDRKIYDQAAEGRRMHVIITPTTTAYPNAAGAAEVGSFNWTGTPVCWCFITTGKSSAETISHEAGHTLGLQHHGTTTLEYYSGQGTGVVGWCPIMGTAGKQVSQWSRGDYPNANRPGQDDLLIITTQNNDVTWRADDTGDTLATARHLEIQADNTVANDGTIETAADVDALRFKTAGGAVTLNVTPASLFPNLDILAELVDAGTGTVVSSSNPDTALNATISTTLAAGEYLLKISGVGRGSPLVDGYTDYASLGTWIVTGSVAGGVKPDRLSIAENTAAPATVGSVTPRNNHGANPLTWSIASGNTNGAFALSSTGVLTVGNAAALDFEALSLRWDDPAAFELFVSITDAAQPELDEMLRVVVTVTDVNEAPTISSASATMLEHTVAATVVAVVPAGDADHFDFPAYSITSGNTGGAFAINPGTGEITVASGIDVASTTVYTLGVQVTDQGTPALTASTMVTITVQDITDGYDPGRIARTYFEGVPGTTVDALIAAPAYPDAPSSLALLTAFDGRAHGTDYGSTLRAFLIPPATGVYQFWIASSDASELRLASSADPQTAVVMGSVPSSTAEYDYDADPAQTSAPVTLQAGQPYYIEARQKKGGSGSDHVSVAWSGPGIERQKISGLFLAAVVSNYAPQVTPATFSMRENALAGHTVGTAVATDVNAPDTFGSWEILSGNTGGALGIDASTGRIYVAAGGVLNATTAPVLTLTVRTSDNGTPALTGTGTITVNVQPAAGISTTGIIQQRWTGILNDTISTMTALSTYPLQPNTTNVLTSFDSGSRTGDFYGSRIRALLTPPVTGTYTLYLSSDDEGQLFLGTTSSPATATLRATCLRATYGNFTQFPSQTATAVTLTAGQQYYIETLHKEASGLEHVQVAWTGPGIATPTVIPGTALQPYDLNTAPAFGSGSYSFTVAAAAPAGTSVGNPVATDPEGEAVVFGIASGNTGGALAIDTATGALTVASSAALTPGTVFNLQVSAQDRGISLVYPLRSATVPVTVTVPLPNMPPTGPASLTKADAHRGAAYSASLAGDFTDPNPGDTLTFSKQAGPAWLTVSAAGALGGTPQTGDVGLNTFTIRIADSGGLFIQSTLSITVTAVNNAPIWVADILTKNAGTIGTAYTATVAADATDPDPGDVLTFSKDSGPSWLSISPAGVLSGTPALANSGLNSWTIRVTDGGGLFDLATLRITVSAPPLTGGWSAADIGTTGVTGATVQSGGRFDQAGGGAGVAGTADAFQIASQTLTGDGEIRGRVSALSGPTGCSAGLMLRNGTAVGAQTVLLAVKGTNLVLSTRVTTGGTATVTTVGTAAAAPNNWFRLSRSGAIITAYSSTDGSIWTQRGAVTLTSPPASLSAGLATSSGNTTQAATASFDNVSLTPFPAPWVSAQIGTVTAAGTSEYFAGAFTGKGAGILGGKTDTAWYTSQTMTGDGQVIARITSHQNTGTSARAGITIRETTATGSKFAFMGVSPDGMFRFTTRSTASAATTTTTSTTATFPNAWVKLVRSGNSLSGYKSADGVTWTLVGSKNISMGSAITAGLITTSGSNATLNTSTFDNTAILP